MDGVGTKQAERIVRNWTETQMRIWDGWLQALQGAGGPKAAEQGGAHIYRVTLDSWEESVRKALESQAEWVRTWTEGVARSAGLTQEAAEGTRLIQEIAKGWIEAQQQFWAGWFDLARRLNPSGLMESWEKVLEAWQKALGTVMDSQKQWFASSTQSTGPRETGTPKSTKP